MPRGTYEHTFAELEYGARVAWRNSSRCIGRLYWQSLKLRDRREVDKPLQIAAECVGHLREATNGGRIRPTITLPTVATNLGLDADRAAVVGRGNRGLPPVLRGG